MTTAHMQPQEQPVCPAADWEIIADAAATPEQRRDAWHRAEAALTPAEED